MSGVGKISVVIFKMFSTFTLNVLTMRCIESKNIYVHDICELFFSYLRMRCSYIWILFCLRVACEQLSKIFYYIL